MGGGGETEDGTIYTSTMDPMGYGNHYLDVPTVAYSEYFRHDSPGGASGSPDGASGELHRNELWKGTEC